jgi:ABC-type multidrug transport system fused ATPase/permease subunit
MAAIVVLAATTLIPLTSLVSFSLYLSSHPASPIPPVLRRRRVQLPLSADEGLEPLRDAFEIENPAVCEDGVPVQPERFWRRQWQLKLALFATYLLPVAANIALLVLTILSSEGLEEHERVRALLLPALLAPAHFVTLIMAFWFFGQNETRTHWATTIHLAAGMFTQFMVVGFLALVPSTPVPTKPISMALFTVHPPLKLISIITSVLPLLQFVPLFIVLNIRRGPPMYIPIKDLLPAKLVDAIPPDHPCLNPDIPNVTDEVNVTIPEWMLFSYSGVLIDRSKVNDSMDVWDLLVLPADQRALPNYIKFKAEYGKRATRFGKWEGYNLLWKLAKVNKWLLVAQASLAAVTGVLYYAPHLLLNFFLTYLENDPKRNHPAWGWVFALGILVSNLFIFLIAGIIWSISSVNLQVRFRLQLNTILFSKTLRKKDIAAMGDDTGKSEEKDGDDKKGKKDKKKKEKSDGEDEGVSSKSQIMTLFTVDVDRVGEFVFHVFTLVDGPIEIIVATFFLLSLLGSSALVGLLTTLLCLPLSHLASKVVVTSQEGLMKARDQRTALMNEVLQGIRMLKFMAWERPFETRVNKIRREELAWQRRNFQIEIAFDVLWAFTPILVTIVSFVHYTVIRGEKLTPAVAFTSIAVFDELRFALNALPETFIQALQGFVSCRRIEKYMTTAEVDAVTDFDGGDVVLTNATFTWPKDDSASGTKSTAPTPRPAFSLADLTLRFPKGKLSLICGRLGSGKSLLLSGLLGEADLVAGQARVPRSQPDTMSVSNDGKPIADSDWLLPGMVAYVPQQAWLQNASIKDNIVFSSPWNRERYDAVIIACSLTNDLEILEDGDETEIGEKGVNLSGGQKARVSLARAIYSRASTLYLDDVLSAVDAHTAHAIMENCLRGPLTADRTVLLVSHHTALVSPSAAFIVALDNGDVKFAGTRQDFVEGGLMKELEAEDPEAQPTAGEVAEEKTVEENIADLKKPTHKQLESISGELSVPGSEPGSETSSIAPTDEATTLAASTDNLIKQKAPRKLIEDEKRVRGRIAWSVWKTYFSALGGPIWWIVFIIATIVSTLVPVFERGWVSYWSDDDAKRPQHSSTFYVSGYAAITVAGCILTNLPYAVVYAGNLRASRILHSGMLKAVLFAPLRFHDTTNRGRLLNRFGKDIEGLDSKMANNFGRSIQYGLKVVCTVTVITYTGGWRFIVALLCVAGLYYKAGSVYGQASRDMRRLDSVTRSPLYSLFGETVSGVAVIRAFGASTVALAQMMKLSDTNIMCFAWTWTVNRWLSSRFNVLSSIMVGVTAMAMLMAGASASIAGFSLAFAGTIMHDLLFVVRRFVQLEQSMVALERIKEYTEVSQEAPEFVEPRPPASWPADGAISVDNLVIRYAPDLPDVLHGISFEVAPREKVGVVGATGCGKSTLALSFFRFVEATGGSITIDGLDIAKIGLTDLRSRIMIIPQDPTILSGTLRSTLDVFDEYEDGEIYEALRRVHLIKAGEEVGAQPSASTEDGEVVRNANVFTDLSYPVTEGGDNFSSGEKQLICMARAILRRNKVLFMDEATASIDYETDELISTTIRAEFSDSTIITIAHRIHTIIDFDKVLVMHRGTIAEYASPAELLRDTKSRFYALCRATGRSEFKHLRELAFAAERRRTNGD